MSRLYVVLDADFRRFRLIRTILTRSAAVDCLAAPPLRRTRLHSRSRRRGGRHQPTNVGSAGSR